MGSVAHHTGELGIATVGSWLTVTTKPGNLGKVQLELVLQPVNGVSGTASQDGNEVVAGEVTSLRTDLVTKGLHVSSEMRTDFLVSSKKILALSWIPRSCWLWVPAPLIPDVALVELPPMNLGVEEGEKVASRRNEGDGIRLFVEEDDIGTSFEESVSGRETGETTTDDNNTSH